MLNKPCFPWLPYILTCAIMPLKSKKDIIITEMTIISYVNQRNYGICGCQGELCPNTCNGKLGNPGTNFTPNLG
jgi:hypothetical protein